ncbi:MarR family winged helix-turn-helix transcriptional regulator [Catenuloplanes atrovinosus]|uniref:DNA-binding MarR family transcriptional regulator n=1 Tax=Catenuloplanes atrovinosus TaxID=137266 RepID=A0AAE4CCK6_9ACTN|nr:MarR family transcriptional regulator [Catenuloplanes atrovinosus]MDR7276615.1 DNA-binding MarR family transcriptional regulator [Catenuloplanes atrovinosus]
MAVDEIAASLLHQVTTIAGQVTGRMQEGLERLDLTGPTANLLWVLNPEDDPQSLRRLATLLHCDPSNISLLSAQLEERGLAERHPHPRDRRVRTLVLTPEGRKVRERLLTVVAQRSPFADLDGEEQRLLQSLLAKALNGPQ